MLKFKLIQLLKFCPLLFICVKYIIIESVVGNTDIKRKERERKQTGPGIFFW